MATTTTEPSQVTERVEDRVVGRTREIELLVAALEAGRDVVLEGPPGTSKSTLLRTIADEWHVPMSLVEGNADLTPTMLVGHHSPASVLEAGYSAESFVPGPLVDAMSRGGFLYVEEFNRAPDDTINTLLAAMSERRVAVPRVGEFTAAPGFRVIASMNPFDNLGTRRLSTSILDRMCRLSIGYQSTAEERDIVAGHLGRRDRSVDDAVLITRATREHPEVRQGSSVRGAIDVALVVDRLAGIRAVTIPGHTGEPHSGPYRSVLRDAVHLGLSGRVHLHRGADVSIESLLDEILAATLDAGAYLSPG